MMAVMANIVFYHAEKNRKRRSEMKIKKSLRDTSNPFTIGDNVFKQHYRMFPHVAVELIELLRPYLREHPKGVPIYLQVLLTTRFLAEGPYQKGLGTDYRCPLSQTSVHRYIHRVINAILHLANRFIKFPHNPEQRNTIQARFQDMVGFPGVLGVMDGTLIKIISPSDHEEAFVDEDQNHSLNVQLINRINL